MKKTILLVGCLALLAIGMISVACSKDWKGCSCTVTFMGERETLTLTAEELEEEGISNCNQAESFIKGAIAAIDLAEVQVNCSNL